MWWPVTSIRPHSRPSRWWSSRKEMLLPEMFARCSPVCTARARPTRAQCRPSTCVFSSTKEASKSSSLSWRQPRVSATRLGIASGVSSMGCSPLVPRWRSGRRTSRPFCRSRAEAIDSTTKPEWSCTARALKFLSNFSVPGLTRPPSAGFRI